MWHRLCRSELCPLWFSMHWARAFQKEKWNFLQRCWSPPEYERGHSIHAISRLNTKSVQHDTLFTFLLQNYFSSRICITILISKQLRNGTYVHQEAQHQQPAGLQQPVQSLGPSHYTAQHEPATCTTSLSIMGVKIHQVKLRHWSTTMQNNVSNKSHFIALNQCFCF